MWIQKVPAGGVLAVAYSPDGRTLYTKDGGGWVSAWDTQSQTGGRAFRPGRDHAYYGGFGLAGRGRYVVAVGRPIFVQDTTTKEVRELNADALTRYQYPSYAIQPDPTSPRLLALNEDGTIGSWDLEAWRTGPVVCALGEPTPHPHLDLTPHGRALVCVQKTLRAHLFDASVGAVTGRFAVDIGRPYFLGQPAPDGESAFFFSDHDIFLWDMTAGAVKAGPVTSYLPGTVFAFHPNAPVFAALNANKQLTLFSLNDAQPIRSLDFALGSQVQCIAFSPDGLTCAVGGSNKQFAVFDVDG